MSSKLKNVLFYTLTLGAVAYLLWIVFSQIDPTDSNGNKISIWKFIVGQAKKANFGFLAISAVCAVSAHIIRAERWRLVLSPMGYNVKLSHSFYSVMVGYFINLVIPRGGEVSRSVALQRMTLKVPVDSGLGTIVAERIIDLIFLLLCVGSVFLIQYDLIMGFLDVALKDQNPSGDQSGISKFLLLAIIGGSLLILVFIFFLIKKELFITLKGKVVSFLKGLKTGLLAIFKLKKAPLFILYSTLIWVMYYLMFYFILKAFPATSLLDINAALTIFTIGGIAMAVPVQGGAGSFHFLVSKALFILFGYGSLFATELMKQNPNLTQENFVDQSSATAIATIFHGWQTLIIIIVGAFSFMMSKKIAKQAKADAQQEQNS